MQETKCEERMTNDEQGKEFAGLESGKISISLSMDCQIIDLNNLQDTLVDVISHAYRKISGIFSLSL